MGVSRRAIGAEAATTGTVGGGAQQTIGLLMKLVTLGCSTRFEVVDDQNGILGDKRQPLIEICRARPRARQTMRDESHAEVLLEQGSQSGLEPAGRPMDEHAKIHRAENTPPHRS